MKSQLSNVQPIELDDREKAFEGRFSIRVIDYENNPEGEEVFAWEKKNLIVNLARKTLAHAIGDLDGKATINQLRLGGDNSLDATELLHPHSPVVTDSDVVYTSNVFVRNRGDFVDGDPAFNGFTVEYPNSPNETGVTFNVTIGRTEGNIRDPEPTVYTCAGLFATNSAGMFASQSFPVISKNSARSLQISWSILF